MSRLFPDYEFVQSITYGAHTVDERKERGLVFTIHLSEIYFCQS